MNSIEARLLDVSRRYIVLAAQLAAAFAKAQAALELEQVLAQPRLETAAGTAQSLADLARFDAMMAAHQQAYSKVVVAFNTEIASIGAALPEASRPEALARQIQAANRQIAVQGEFYVNRARWLRAATDICMLVDAQRDAMTFGSEGALFADADALATFTAQMAVIEDVHRREVQLYDERMERIRQSAAALGVLVRD